MTALLKQNRIEVTPLIVLAVLALISMFYSMYQITLGGVHGDVFAYHMAKFLFSAGLAALFVGAEDYREAKRMLFGLNSGKKGKQAMWFGVIMMIASLTTYCMIMLG